MKKLSAQALAALSNTECTGTAVVIRDQLDRSVYVEVNKALEALGGKWQRKLKAHIFPTEAQPLIDALLTEQGYVDKKKELGFFPTPATIADLLVRLADIKPGMSVLEPSAGRGHLVDAIRLACKDLPSVHANEIDPANVEALRAKYKAAMGPAGVVRPAGVIVEQWDFLKRPLTDGNSYGPFRYDRIVMNPPFAKHADVEHVMHAFKFLRPGGRLVAVMSNHVTFADDNTCREFRAYLAKYTAIFKALEGVKLPLNGSYRVSDNFLHLPQRSFVASGTGVSTVVIVMEALR